MTEGRARSGDPLLDFLAAYRLPAALIRPSRRKIIYANAAYQNWDSEANALDEQILCCLLPSGSSAGNSEDPEETPHPIPRFPARFSTSHSSVTIARKRIKQERLWTATSVEDNNILILAQDDANDPVADKEAFLFRTLPTIDLPWQEQKRFNCITDGGGEMGQRIRELDWSQTKLGAIERWPQKMVELIGLVMHSPMPMTAYIGPEYIIVYNDGFRSCLGNTKHPRALGQPAREIWAEIWDDIAGPLENTMNGHSFSIENHRMLWQRLTGINQMEEVFANWQYVPVYDREVVIGNLLILYERNGQSDPITKRRMDTIFALGDKLVGAKSVTDLCRSSCEALAGCEYDLPYVASYQAIPYAEDEEMEMAPHVSISSAGSSTSRSGEDRQLLIFSLQETVGAAFDSLLAPSKVIVQKQATVPVLHPAYDPSSTWANAFSQVYRTGEIQVIEDIRKLLTDAVPRGMPGIQPYRAVIVPLKDATERVLGCFLLVVNACLPYDATFQRFIHLISRQLNHGLSIVLTLDSEMQKAEQLAALDAAKTAFFTSVSHELRTPLQLILGPLKDVLSHAGSLTPYQNSQLSLVSRNARRLLRLVNSILDFARAEAKAMTAQFCPVLLGSMTGELVASFRGAAELAHLDFSFHADDSSDIDATWVDIDNWEKVVYNLMSNAVKFSDKGAIEAKTWADPRFFYFSVRDTGIGIPADELAKIFEKFHRVQAKEARTVVGSGIGLALTLELVKLNGGRLSVDSTFGKGSIFTVRLPIGNSHLPKRQLIQANPTTLKIREEFVESVAEETSLWNATSTEYSEDPQDTIMGSAAAEMFTPLLFGPRQKASVLIADDNNDIRAYIRSILGKHCHIAEASDGETALAKLKAQDFDLLISDIMMPRKDGYALLRDVRADPDLHSLPVILLSARAGEDVGLDGLRAGADEYIVKPFTSKELLLRVQQHLQRGNVRMELEQRVAERTALLEGAQIKYYRLADLLQVGIHTSDASGTITWANRRWHNSIGLDESNWHDWASIIDQNDRQRAVDAFSQQPFIDSVLELSVRSAEAVSLGRGYEVPIELLISNSSGESMHIVYDLQPEHDSAGNLTGFIGTFSDISSLRRLEQERVELERAKREEAENNKVMLERFIDITCHELRNPLNAIYHSAELLGESLSRLDGVLRSQPILTSDHAGSEAWARVKEDLQEDINAVQTIALCARHQKRIADDVLHMSKLSGDMIRLVEEEFDPVAAVNDVIKMFLLETAAKDITTSFVCHPSLNHFAIKNVIGDVGRFSQVCVNLFANAIRFTENASTRQLRLSLGVDVVEDADPYASLGGESDDMSCLLPALADQYVERVEVQPGRRLALHFAIADSGAGMTAEERSRIFQRFAQASPKTYRQFGGIGLGLWISKRLVEMQGGRVDLQSVKDRGTILRFYILVNMGDGQASNALNSPILNGHVRTPAAEFPPPVPIKRVLLPGQKPRILVVEDNIINQKVLCRLLANIGCETTTADDGAHCLEQIDARLAQSGPVEGSVFDLILMDLEMPIMNGTAAALRIRAEESSGRYPLRQSIVAVTANARDHYQSLSYESGMDGFLRKPYSKQDLASIINQFVEFRL